MPKILVVADAPWVVNDVHASLADTAYDVSVIGDPAIVGDEFTDLAPDAVVIDLQVGSMGGMAITRSIRNAARTAGVAVPPVIVLLDRDVDAFLARRAGADAHLRKPFGGFALRDLVDRLTAGEAAPASAE
ncbi:MAG: response regulator [Acidimicrobiia bacterium]|nr:response regulator [Acidimicrobiia bacterium]